MQSGKRGRAWQTACLAVANGPHHLRHANYAHHTNQRPSPEKTENCITMSSEEEGVVPATAVRAQDVWTRPNWDFEERHARLQRKRALACTRLPAAPQVSAKRLPRERVTAAALPPRDAPQPDPFGRLLLRFWSAPWVLLEPVNTMFRPDPVAALASLPRLAYEGAAADAPHTSASTPCSAATLPSFASPHWSAAYNPDWDWCRGVVLPLTERNYHRIADPHASKVFQQAQSVQFHVVPGEPVFAAGSLEPFFCSLLLIHSKERAKVSESFHFAHLGESVVGPMTSAVGSDGAGDVLAAPSCVFSVSIPSRYVYLVLVVRRLLQGDAEKTAEAYTSSAASSAPAGPLAKAFSKLNKLKEFSADMCARLGSFQQNFCFGFAPVFDTDGRFILGDATSFDRLWFHAPGEELADAIAAISGGAKRKSIIGSCSFKARRITVQADDLIPLRMDAALFPYVHNAASDAQLLAEPARPGPPGYVRDLVDLVPVSKPVPSMAWSSSLFVRLHSLALYSRKALAVRVECRASDESTVVVPLKCLFTSAGGARRILNDTCFSTCASHSKTALWFDEDFRLHLPRHVTPKHHLVFFVYEVDVDVVRKRRAERADTLVAAAFLPLLLDGVIVGADPTAEPLALPLVSCAQALPRGYLSLANDGKLPLLDNGKECLTLSARAVTSALPLDRTVATVCRLYHVSSDPTEEPLLLEALRALHDVQVQFLIPHFPVLMLALLHIMRHRRGGDAAQAAFQAMVRVLTRVHEAERRPSEQRCGTVHQWIDFAFEPGDADDDADLPATLDATDSHPSHLAIAMQFMTFSLLMSKGAVSVRLTTLCHASWMLFDLLYKAMVCSLTPAVLALPRQRHFPADFSRVLKKLYASLLQLILHVADKGTLFEEAAVLSNNMALYLSELLNVFDRGIVCDIFVQHVRDLRAHAASTQPGSATSAKLVLDFVKIFSDHDQFVALSLPRPLPKGHSLDTEQLRDMLRERHPVLVDAFVDTILAQLGTGPRALALSVLVNLITKIDRDPRFSLEADRHAIAVMFFPVVLHLVCVWDSLEEWRLDASRLFERQELNAAVVWILRNVRRSWLRSWWCAARVFVPFCALLKDLVAVFRYHKDALDVSTPYCTTSANVDSLVDLAQGVDVLHKTRRRLGLRGVMAQQQLDASTQDDGTLRMGVLAFDVGLLVLSASHDLFADFGDVLWIGQRLEATPEAGAMVNVIMALLDGQCCAEIAPHVFALAHKWCKGQGPALFTVLKSETSRVVQATLRLCGSSVEMIRSQACSFFYSLLQRSVALVGSFEAVKSAAIVACSRLTEKDRSFGSGGALRSALDAVADQALAEFISPLSAAQAAESGDQAADGVDEAECDVAAQRKCVFVRQVQDLTLALSKIVHDTLDIVRNKDSKDVEMLADSYYRISEGYRQTPELRLEWLEKLAQFHARNGDFPEAAVAMAHVVALVSDFLNHTTETRVDMAVFKRICPTISEFYDDELAAGGSSFSLRHWKFAIKATIKFFEQGELYEMANDLYRILLRVYHTEGSYRDLGNAHGQLETFFSRLADNDSGRLLGRYYRVAFFGRVFGDLDGREFVYKEKLLTHLFALKERLLEHYAAVLGAGVVEVMDHGGVVDVATLDPAKGYLQITSVRPVWPPEEDALRTTFIRRNTGLSNFALETPVSSGGKVGQTTTADQYMRRTILTTQSPFPYLLKRIPVRSRRDVLVTPIELAIETMQARNEKLRAEIEASDSKTLPQVLQGSVLTTVNRGLIEYLEIFFAQRDKYERRFVKQLEAKFREFFVCAEEALRVNQRISTPSQMALQHEMQKGFAELLKLAAPFVRPDDDEDFDTASTSSPRSHGGSPRSSAASPRSQESSSSSGKVPPSPGRPTRTSGGSAPSVTVTPSVERPVDRLRKGTAPARSSSGVLDLKKKPRRTSSSLVVSTPGGLTLSSAKPTLPISPSPSMSPRASPISSPRSSPRVSRRGSTQSPRDGDKE